MYSHQIASKLNANIATSYRSIMDGYDMIRACRIKKMRILLRGHFIAAIKSITYKSKVQWKQSTKNKLKLVYLVLPNVLFHNRLLNASSLVMRMYSIYNRCFEQV